MTTEQLKLVCGLLRLAENTFTAAHMVLIAGMSQSAAARANGMYATNLRRALRSIRALHQDIRGAYAQD